MVQTQQLAAAVSCYVVKMLSLLCFTNHEIQLKLAQTQERVAVVIIFFTELVLFSVV